ncbi:MAG: hypothetical protein HY072_09520 [Deltaproteobacteria bacterium]|nr:hypothetical protein [Deltaproteobacteria bacterium]
MQSPTKPNEGEAAAIRDAIDLGDQDTKKTRLKQGGFTDEEILKIMAVEIIN